MRALVLILALAACGNELDVIGVESNCEWSPELERIEFERDSLILHGDWEPIEIPGCVPWDVNGVVSETLFCESRRYASLWTFFYDGRDSPGELRWYILAERYACLHAYTVR